MSDIDRYAPLLDALAKDEIGYLCRGINPNSNLRLPSDPFRALKDMEAALDNFNQPKGLNNERTRKKT
jgi:hypothetical protein